MMTLDWRAPFITPSTDHSGEETPASYFRKEIQLEAKPTRALLRVTAVGIVEPWLNGTRVGDEVLAPGWTSYRNRLIASTYDVTDDLHAGGNVIGAVVADGWALGRLGWDDRSQHFSDRRGLSVQLELTYADRTETVVSDESWSVGTGATRSASIYDGETHDARLEPDGWDAPGFDDEAWSSAVLLDWAGPVEDPTSEPIRRVEELAPVAVLRTPSGRTVLDFGQEISGWVRLHGTVPEGREITLRHAEWMTGGEIDLETLRTAKATDVYTGNGRADQEWEPRFTFHGFRYVQVDGWEGDDLGAAFRAVVVHTDMRRTGWLTTSDERLNRLHENVVWSMRDNFVGVPTDCPQRDERLGWTGDINAFAPTASFLYDVRGVLGSWLRDLALEQQEKGFVPWVVPDVLSNASTPTALWSDVAVSLPWTLYQHYGDAAILERSYESMTSFVRDVAGRLDEHATWSSGFQYGDWLDPDAPDENPAGGKTDRHLVATAYFAKVAREMAQAAEVLDASEDAAEFTALADRVRAGFLREYVTPAGRLTNESATAYALAIVFDLLDPEQRAHAGDRLADVVAKNGYTISTGFAGTPLVTDALSSTGHLEEAYLLLTQERCPSFLYPVSMGATTIWERWDSVRQDGTINPSGMTSLNHYALGAVADWMHRTIGGLTATAPGYRSVRIAPLPGVGLTSASLVHDVVDGRIEVSWSLEDGRGRLAVTLPDGTSAEIVPPLHAEGLVEQVEGGTHEWEYALADDPTASVVTMDTPLSKLGASPTVWARISEVFARHLPGIPIDATAPEAAGISLSTMLDFIPGDSSAMRTDLEDVIAAVSGSSTKEAVSA
ncbi:alpha-L-rhamnosidase [Curtobacterium sp. 260]|uniref:alpha-L-rhamnosidase n=1 Tax=Curtobacterium sp. 260 TaxID=2817748 RepID=UPI002781A72B|nr:family 78 glycoside hydrolase catalytic domain [Curtobacterium sp. 260]MDP9736822.1 alpha-L-rhamnosidase [Curtobacterium sp. 260]